MKSSFSHLSRTAGFILLLSLPQTSHAKDLRNKIGVGFDTELGETPALSVRYGLPTANSALNFQVELDVGLATYDGAAASTVGGRLLYGIVIEDNLNLYAGAGAGLIQAPGQEQILRLQPALAADFFLFGLEHLGFTASWGLNIDAGGDQAGIGTTAAVLGGLHYWF